MSNSNSKLFVLVLAGSCVFGAWKLGTALFGSDEAQATDKLVNQVWIDHMPADHRDMVTHLVVLDHREGKFGAIGQSSTWRHSFEVFKWKLSGNQLDVYFPQESVRGRVTVKTWRCEGDAPEPFELCLQLSNPSGNETAMLYSRDDWKIRPRAMLDSFEAIADDYPQLAGLFEELSETQVEQLEDLDVDDVRWHEGATLLR